jgi:hypothetical protein
MFFFQLLSYNKDKDTFTIVTNGQVLYNQSLKDISEQLVTYEYNSSLKDTNTEYVKFFFDKELNLEQMGKDNKNFLEVKEELNKHLESLRCCKITPSSELMLKVLPENLIVKYYSYLNEFTKELYHLTKDKRTSRYNFQVELQELLNKISLNELKINPHNSELNKRFFAKALSLKERNKILYKQFGTVTGRLSTEKGSFPILQLDKELRKIIYPKNNVFVEFDYNAADPRMFLALIGKEQPQQDVYEILQKHTENLSRIDAKKQLLTWMYDHNHEAEKNVFFDKNDIKKLLDKHFGCGIITNVWGNEIQCEREKAISYLVQSSLSELFLRQVLKLDKLLQNRKSFVSFTIHDSVVLDLAKEDFDTLKELKKEFAETPFGTFKVNCKAGSNFGNMKGK